MFNSGGIMVSIIRCTLFFFIASVALAQTGGSRITGTVTDASGALVRGASVTARNEASEPRVTILPATGNRYVISDFIGDHAGSGDGPQGFLVEFPNPGGELRPHWHEVNQYQVVVEGDCNVGAHRAAPITVHYADAYTTYGPIIAGDEGFSFFTLRGEHTRGTYYMPQSKHLLPRKRGREIVRHAADVLDGLAPDSCTVEPLIEPHADGLMTTLISLGPRSTASAPSPNEGGGQYYLVASGSVIVEEQEKGRLSLLFVSPNEKAPQIRAGPDGAVVVCMQLPRKAAEEAT